MAALAILATVVSPTEAGRTLRRMGAEPRTVSQELGNVIEREGGGAPVLVLSTTVPGGFPAVNYAGVDWTLRLSCLWPLPAVVRSRAGAPEDTARLSAAEADEIESYLRRIVVEDLRLRSPGLVFVDRRASKQAIAGLPLDLLAFLRDDPEFAALWRDYEPIGRVGPFEMHRRRSAGRSS